MDRMEEYKKIRELSKKLWALPIMVKLEKKLLSIGGTKVVYMPELDGENYVKNGKLIEYKNIRMARHPFIIPSHCHENSAFIWLDRLDKGYKIATGYALSADGLWRQHSWTIQRNTIVETTERREKYFGIILDDVQAIKFCENEIPIHPIKKSIYSCYRGLLNELKKYIKEGE